MLFGHVVYRYRKGPLTALDFHSRFSVSLSLFSGLVNLSCKVKSCMSNVINARIYIYVAYVRLGCLFWFVFVYMY